MSHPLQSSSIDKWIDAPTRRVDAAGATFVYRRLGPATGVPVILLNHWGAVLLQKHAEAGPVSFFDTDH